jgi:DNA ligase-1
MQEILDIISEMNRDNSNTHKLSVLNENSNHQNFLKVLFYTYNEMYQYYITPKSFKSKPASDVGISFDGVINLLDDLRMRKIRPLQVNDMIPYMSQAEFEVFTLILDRNLKIKVDAKSINKIIPGFIPVTSYMRCSLPKDGNEIEFPCFSQIKSDGMFVNVVCNDKAVEVFSRNGKPIPLDAKGLIKSFNHSLYENWVFNGELLVYENGKPLNRQTGNGLISSLAKKVQTELNLEEKIATAKSEKARAKLQEELNDNYAEWAKTDANIVMHIWDLLPVENWISGDTYEVKYKDRFATLVSMFDSSDEKVQLIETIVCDSLEEIQNHYNKVREEGEEGTIIKNFHGFWENKTSKNQIKQKAEKEVELICIGWNPGDPSSEFKEGIGSLIMESSCGRVKVNVSGLKRHERGLQPKDAEDLTLGLERIPGFDFDKYNGKIFTVRYNEVLTKKDSDIVSLFLPRIVEERMDKSIADDYSYIIKV